MQYLSRYFFFEDFGKFIYCFSIDVISFRFKTVRTFFKRKIDKTILFFAGDDMISSDVPTQFQGWTMIRLRSLRNSILCLVILISSLLFINLFFGYSATQTANQPIRADRDEANKDKVVFSRYENQNSCVEDKNAFYSKLHVIKNFLLLIFFLKFWKNNGKYSISFAFYGQTWHNFRYSGTIMSL